MTLVVFFLLQSTRHFLRVESLRNQFIVFAVVLLSSFRKDLDLGRLLLLVSDADH